MYFKDRCSGNKKLGLHYLEKAAELGDKETKFLDQSYSKPESPFYSPKKTKYLFLYEMARLKKSVKPFPKDKIISLDGRRIY